MRRPRAGRPDRTPGSEGRTRTPRLLRRYFPKGTDFATVSEAHLDAGADELNDRPRKRLGFAKPIEEIAELLLQ